MNHLRPQEEGKGEGGGTSLDLTALSERRGKRGKS